MSNFMISNLWLKKKALALEIVMGKCTEKAFTLF